MAPPALGQQQQSSPSRSALVPHEGDMIMVIEEPDTNLSPDTNNNSNNNENLVHECGRDLVQQIAGSGKDCDPALIKSLLQLHGSPSDLSDQCKTLEQIMLDSERDICIFAGAIQLLQEQLAEAKHGGCCPVCARCFGSSCDFDNCLNQINVKTEETEMAREESRVMEIYNAARVALSKSDCCSTTARGKTFESRVQFNMRSGSLTELRNQKAECLMDQSCFACMRALQGADVVSYLQRVDRNASQMQDRLHVHN